MSIRNNVFSYGIKIFLIQFIFFLNCFKTCLGQYTLIKLHYEAKNIADTFPFHIYNVINYPVFQLQRQELKIADEKLMRNGKENIMTARISSENLKTAIIGNGLGGCEIFIGPNDTIEININRFQDGKKFLIDSIRNYMFLNFKYINKNQIIHQFFDSLAYIAGQVNMDNVSFADAHHDINTFFKMATLQYSK